MDPLPANSLLMAAAVGGGLLLLGILVALWVWLRRRRLAAARLAAVTGGAHAYLRNVLLLDAQGLPLHIDFLLLTVRGAVIIDLRDVRGNVFGGEHMSEWTVMDRNNRTTFINPLPALLDRIAAVRALVTELPVDGQIVFDSRSQFPKGLPSHARLLESLSDEHTALNTGNTAVLPAQWHTDWQAICAASRPSSLIEPKSAV